jgi:hypothetical protein
MHMSNERRPDSEKGPPNLPFEAVALGAFFCANPACVLHVRAGDPGVTGEGDWAVLADGRTFGRSRHGNTVLCDACGTGRGPVKMSLPQMTMNQDQRDARLAEESNQND